MHTDPPYNVNYCGGSRPIADSRPKKHKMWEQIYNDNLSQEEYEIWFKKVINNVIDYLDIGAAFYIWNGHSQFGPMHKMLEALGCNISCVITWAKPNFAIGYQNKTSISFSDSILELYNVLDKFFYKNIISSKEVQEQDAKCEEKIIAIFDHYKKDPAKLWKKYALGSLLEQQARYVEERYGFDQVVVDYIQWLSDERANEEYKKIAKSN